MGLIKNIFRKENLFAVVVVFLLVLVLLQVGGLNRSISNLEQSSRAHTTEIGNINESIIALGSDLNETRKFLLMPTREYFVVDADAGVDSQDADKNTNDLQLAMFEYVGYVANATKKEAVIEKYKSFIDSISKDEEFLNFLADNKLSVNEVNDSDVATILTISSNEGLEVIKYYLSKEEGIFYMKSALEKSAIDAENFEGFIAEVRAYLMSNQDKIINIAKKINDADTKIMSAINSEDVQAYVEQSEIKIGNSTEADLKRIYPIFDVMGKLIGEVVLDLLTQEIQLVDKEDEANKLMANDPSLSLLPFLKNLNKNMSLMMKVEEAKANVEALLSDKGFQLLLSESGLTMSSEMTEGDDERIFYKLMNTDGMHISSIVIEPQTGVVNIVDLNGTNSINILNFDPEDKKKNLEIPSDIPDYGDALTHEDGTFNILIAGKHGNLVDTMIFAHIDEVKHTVRMISIPRDLFYNGRKINSFAFFYGMDELKRVLSEISGYKLDKFILIDMYAFIDVIDLIGGIDVHLDKAVIDPTYRTVDNGVEGTLHYEPGDYHFGGKESLRIARSRHTSSDFARADRQQLILKAIQDKAKNMGFGDTDTFYEIVKTVISKTETDIAIDEAIAYYFRYQNFDIVSNNVMSSGNVLYVPPYVTVEQCAARVAAAQAAGESRPGCENENHAYTLSPRNNDWNIVKWFFKENFEG